MLPVQAGSNPGVDIEEQHAYAAELLPFFDMHVQRYRQSLSGFPGVSYLASQE